MRDPSEHVTLEDVASARVGLEQAKVQTQSKKRASVEWASGGILFSTAFALATWFVRPNAPLAAYVLIVVVSFVTATVAVYLNWVQREKWYRLKGSELDVIESRIRSGELMPRQNQSKDDRAGGSGNAI